ncbi:hypothetical protein [Salinigranum halophilum]|uniref:hypothetical protein n=1 Tax=Salinigranum halophilum TaxID=2565931 RepID=UPI0010A9387C|nr:hypothetical protein [Salinigranum halophilum]
MTESENSRLNIWVEKTEIHGDWKEPDTTPYSLGTAIVSPQEAKGGRDYYRALREAKVGDIVLHLLQDEYSIVGASVVDSELLTDQELPEFILDRWKPEQQEQGGYVRKLREFTRLDSPLDVKTDILSNPTYKEDLKEIRENHERLFYTTWIRKHNRRMARLC